MEKSANFKEDLNDVVSCTSLGGINIRMLGFVIQVMIYILRPEIPENLVLHFWQSFLVRS